MNAPVLVLGLDMGDGDLIRLGIRRGRLPHLAALVEAGTSLQLETPAEVLHTSTWPTFATGVLPGQHGVYYPLQPTPGQQFARRIQADQYGAETFWLRADADGRRCVVYDVPETFPERKFGGRAVFDWGTWAHYGRSAALPPGLLKQLESGFGSYPLGYEAIRLGFDEPRDIEQRLFRSIRYKAASARWLLGREPWDLAVVGFGETHAAGHYLWPRGAKALSPEDGRFEALLAIYAAVDEAIGILRAAVPPDCRVIVVSGDGVRANHCGWHLLPEILQRLGLTSSGSNSSDAQPASRLPLTGRVAQLVPPAVKRQIAASLPWQIRNRLALWAQASATDWSCARAFALPSDLEGCVRLNVKGREPHGIVEPGAEYEDLCHEMCARFEELVNPVTGAAAVRRVWIRNEVFPGPQREELPDLIVTWNDEAPISAVTSSRIGLIEGVNPDPRPGTHSTSGFLVAHGPGFPQNYQGRARLVDVAPTVLQALGVSQAPGMDGSSFHLPHRDESLPNQVQA